MTTSSLIAQKLRHLSYILATSCALLTYGTLIRNQRSLVGSNLLFLCEVIKTLVRRVTCQGVALHSMPPGSIFAVFVAILFCLRESESNPNPKGRPSFLECFIATHTHLILSHFFLIFPWVQSKH